MFKKILCAILAILMFVPALVSCANNEEDDKNDETADPNKDVQADVPEFHEDSFGDEDFKFLIYDSEAGGDFADAYIWSDGVTGSTIGDAVLDRNRLVEEKYGVVITAELCSPMSEAVKRMQAGQCDFEVIYEWGVRSKSAALDGMLYDFLDLPYTDFEQSYWVPGTTDELTIGGHLFIYTNYITMNSLSWAGMMYFNKAILEKLQYEEPYDYVYADEWTYDVLLDMVKGADEDIDGDGAITASDQWGSFCGLDIGNVCNEPLTKKNDDGSYTLVGYTESMLANYQKYESDFAQVTSIGYEEVWASGSDTSAFPSQHIAARFLAFGEDHCLFMGGSIDMTREFVNMKSNYGVVPWPVVNKGDEYVATVDTCAPMFSIPVQVQDPDMVGTILEYMAYESEKILLPAYYETTIKTKSMEDVRDYDMLDIVRNAASYEWVSVYMWDSDVMQMRGQMMSAGHFASVWKRYATKGQAELDEIVETLEAISIY